MLQSDDVMATFEIFFRTTHTPEYKQAVTEKRLLDVFREFVTMSFDGNRPQLIVVALTPEDTLVQYVVPDASAGVLSGIQGLLDQGAPELVFGIYEGHDENECKIAVFYYKGGTWRIGNLQISEKKIAQMRWNDVRTVYDGRALLLQHGLLDYEATRNNARPMHEYAC